MATLVRGIACAIASRRCGSNALRRQKAQIERAPRMGDIRGRPNKEDLEKIKQNSQKLVQEVFIHGRSDT
jgi:hypothetical protein